MMIDSAFIMIYLRRFASANSIAELHITQRQQEERYRYHDKDHVLHATSFKCTNFSSRSELDQYRQVQPDLSLAKIRRPPDNKLETGYIAG